MEFVTVAPVARLVRLVRRRRIVWLQLRLRLLLLGLRRRLRFEVEMRRPVLAARQPGDSPGWARRKLVAQLEPVLTRVRRQVSGLRLAVV